MGREYDGRGDMGITAQEIKELATDCGFELAGVARAQVLEDAQRYARWVAEGMAGAV